MLFEDNFDDDADNVNGPLCMYYDTSELDKFFNQCDSGSFNAMHVNVRSLSKNFSSFSELLSVIPKEMDCIAVTETWLNPHSCTNFFQLRNYDFVHVPRPDKIGGGVGLYIRNDYTFRIRQDLTESNLDLESIFVEVTSNQGGTNIIMGCLYRPPNTDLISFNTNMSKILRILEKERNKVLIITGDFNLDLIKCSDHGPTSLFVDLLAGFSLLPCITKPTRITDVSSTLLDNFFINLSKIRSKSAIIYSDVSDHLPIILNINVNTKKDRRTPMIVDSSKRVFTLENTNVFKAMLDDVDWNFLSDCRDNPNELYEAFFTKYLTIFEKCFPTKSTRPQKRNAPRVIWMTKGLVASCNKKSKLLKKYKLSGSAVDRKIFVKYRNKLKSIIKKAEKDFYGQKLDELKGNVKETWKVLNSLLKKSPDILAKSFQIDNTAVTDPLAIADSFNTFFATIGSSLASTIPAPANHFSSYLKGSYLNSCALDPTCEAEIISIVYNFDLKSSAGWDEIPISLVKNTIMPIASALTTVFNSTLSTGIFPDKLKVAKIIPIHKNGPKDIVANYRPISLLPTFSKIIEKIIQNRLLSYIDKNNILSNNQYGFRAKHSTLLAVTDFYDSVSKSIDKSNYVIGIFLDLSKAFDTLDYDILLSKLEFYGIRGMAQHLLHSYLSNRKQYVHYNNMSSGIKYVTMGVPQGSILGPLLFLLYINDIEKASTLLHFILFADDTNLLLAHKNLDVLIALINAELSKVACWFECNRLSINVLKSNFIFFGSKSRPPSITLRIADKVLAEVDSVKFLGVLIDSKLCWKNHIHHVCTKMSRSIGVINNVKRLLPQNVLKLLYYTLVYPHLTYCITIWGQASSTSLSRVLMLQKRMVRIIDNAYYLDHSALIFTRLQILRIGDIYKLYAYLVMFKHLNNMIPRHCINYLSLVDISTNRYCTRIMPMYVVPHFRTNIYERGLAVSGPRLWNGLPEHLQHIKSVSHFKIQIKQHLSNQLDNISS
jgi:Reverse transcriptase (RNA-dependent DNA polymerase)/Endonuclease-reverse transcriptase